MNQHDDKPLDARLRDVPVPAGILGRVTLAALFDEAAIDRLLARVEVPAGLEQRVRKAVTAGQIVVPPRMDSTIHGAGGRAEGPEGRSAASSGRRRIWLAIVDLVADGGAVAIALSIVALMFWAGTELSRRLAAPAPFEQRVAVDAGTAPRPLADDASPKAGGKRVASGEASQAGAVVAGGGVAAARSPGDVGNGRRSRPSAAPSNAAPANASAVGDSGDARQAAAHTADVEVRAAPSSPSMASAERRGGRAGIRAVFLPAAGRQVPRVPGFDIAFEMAHGESPFIDPTLDAVLAVDHPPLSLRTDSFDSLCESVWRDRGRPIGRRPRRAGEPSVRVEEILAALPAATTAAGPGPGPGLSINGVRSLRAAAGSLLVEVCVTAPKVSEDAVQAAHPLDVMLVLDQSAAPCAALSWQWQCRGLAHVMGQMRSADRLSLVLCGERPRLVALRADAATLSALLPELMREPVVRWADCDAAVRLAADVGRREGLPVRTVVVAHAASLERCRKEGRAALSAWQAKRAAAPVEAGTSLAEAGASWAESGASPADFVVIDPQESAGAATAATATTARAAVVAGRITADPIAIGRAMVARVFDRPTLVAVACTLDVAFDPGRVGSYRIIGHRQSAADTLSTVTTRPLDLYAGETARVVYEVICRPGGGPGQGPGQGPGLVSATLAWTPSAVDAGGHVLEQRVRAALTEASVTGMEPRGVARGSLRAGLPAPQGCELLLAVALGELAGASVHSEPWREPATGIASLVSRWQARGDVTPIGGLLIECLGHQGVSLPDPAAGPGN
jgi:hypothetical protein